MPFRADERMQAVASPTYGEYVTTFNSKNSQVRADLFKRGELVTAHVAFANGLGASKATDSYYSELLDYANEHGFRDRFRVIYIENGSH